VSQIRGRHVLVTGGASGIGRGVARRLAARGGRLSVWDLDAGRLEAALDELKDAGPETPSGFVCDVSQREHVRQSAAETVAAGGPVDVLVNNAGVVSGQPLLGLSDEQIERTFAINVLALFWVTRAFLPAMVEHNRGHLVTIASASSLIGVARLSDYAASKWAAMGFDESLRAELRELAPGVVTTVVCPFYVDTGMFAGVRTRFPRLLPILDPGDVADRVVEAIEHDRRRLVLPRLVGLLPVLRVLPVGVFDWIARFLGVNASMDEFRGHG
jgi:all-trans-retinol dehydrogenase (NAD+)